MNGIHTQIKKVGRGTPHMKAFKRGYHGREGGMSNEPEGPEQSHEEEIAPMHPGTTPDSPRGRRSPVPRALIVTKPEEQGACRVHAALTVNVTTRTPNPGPQRLIAANWEARSTASRHSYN